MSAFGLGSNPESHLASSFHVSQSFFIWNSSSTLSFGTLHFLLQIIYFVEWPWIWVVWCFLTIRLRPCIFRWSHHRRESMTFSKCITSGGTGCLCVPLSYFLNSILSFLPAGIYLSAPLLAMPQDLSFPPFDHFPSIQDISLLLLYFISSEWTQEGEGRAQGKNGGDKTGNRMRLFSSRRKSVASRKMQCLTLNSKENQKLHGKSNQTNWA